MDEESTAPARDSIDDFGEAQRKLATGGIDWTWWRNSRTVSLEERLERRATNSSGEEQWLHGTKPATHGWRGVMMQ
ncbi:hypothetical protein Scep_001988 [Stephania cephalantha]|uniref:Uncharacterized protein n=1 Tax=Stephania cephalantha TaxID=152367 RepID=A0AAP0L932_9MAGN